MSDTDLPMRDFLSFLSYYGLHLDDPALGPLADDLGLTGRETISEEEMGLVLHALAEVVRKGLSDLDGPAADSYARLSALGAGVVDLVAMPE